MAYPSSLTSLQSGMQGTTLFSDATNDHALQHRELGSVSNSLQAVLGTTGGTSVLKNFAVGDFAARINASNVLQQSLQGTINNSTLGTPAITGGTMNSGVLGTPSATGGTFVNPVLGTPSIDAINARTSGTGIYINNPLYPAHGSLTDTAGGTLTPDMGTAQLYYCVLGTAAGNRTIATPTNIGTNTQLTLAFKASGSANGTLVWGTVFRISQDFGTPSIGTGTSWNYYSWRYNNIDSHFDFNGQVTNLA